MRVLKDRNEATQSTDTVLDTIKCSLALITPTKAHFVMRVYLEAADSKPSDNSSDLHSLGARFASRSGHRWS